MRLSDPATLTVGGEFAVRLRAIGLADGDTFDLPITQTELADATGMSVVHTNRTLQELRARKLIAWKGASLEILNWDELTADGDFDPAYLHLKSGERLQWRTAERGEAS